MFKINKNPIYSVFEKLKKWPQKNVKILVLLKKVIFMSYKYLKLTVKLA